MNAPVADLAASRPAVQGLWQAVQHHLGYLGEDVVTRVTARILIEQARNNSGDVTAHD